MTQFSGIHKITIPIPFPIESVNVFLLEGPPLSLVDTGLRDAATLETLRQAFARIGRKLEDLERIYITHGHLDHFGLAQTLVRISGATVFVHEQDAAKVTHESLKSLEEEPSLLGMFLEEAGLPSVYHNYIKQEFLSIVNTFSEPVPEVVTFPDGDEIACGDRKLRVVHLPGHSVGQVCFFEPSERLLFSGDHLLPTITPNPLLDLEAKARNGYQSLKTYLASLEATRALDALHVLPGHGDVFSCPGSRIDAILQHHEQRSLEVLRILENGAKTKWQLCQELFCQLEQREVFLGLSEVEGHLELLEEKGAVNRQYAGNHLMFCRT